MDEELTKCCEKCEQYTGSEHEYEECRDCPVLALYKKYKDLKWRMSWMEMPKDLRR